MNSFFTNTLPFLIGISSREGDSSERKLLQQGIRERWRRLNHLPSEGEHEEDLAYDSAGRLRMPLERSISRSGKKLTEAIPMKAKKIAVLGSYNFLNRISSLFRYEDEAEKIFEPLESQMPTRTAVRQHLKFFYKDGAKPTASPIVEEYYEKASVAKNGMPVNVQPTEGYDSYLHGKSTRGVGARSEKKIGKDTGVSRGGRGWRMNEGLEISAAGKGGYSITRQSLSESPVSSPAESEGTEVTEATEEMELMEYETSEEESVESGISAYGSPEYHGAKLFVLYDPKYGGRTVLASDVGFIERDVLRYHKKSPKAKDLSTRRREPVSGE